MSAVVNAGRTHMGRTHICIGGHDLDNEFRAVRLLDPFGDPWTRAARFMVGETWDIQYRLINSKPPHVEDVRVDDYRRLNSDFNLHDLVMVRARPWVGHPEELFHRTVMHTPSGASYVPSGGQIPHCSTGYWIPSADLVAEDTRGKVRFAWTPRGTRWRMTWVGVQAHPAQIKAGTLVRVSLSRVFKPETAPEGFYVQISGLLL